MSPEEQAAYQRGYKAGRRRPVEEEDRMRKIYDRITSETTRRQDALFNSVLATIINANGWTFGGASATTTTQRIQLSLSIAREAWKQIEYGL